MIVRFLKDGGFYGCSADFVKMKVSTKSEETLVQLFDNDNIDVPKLEIASRDVVIIV